jgi:hypothetical protein
MVRPIAAQAELLKSNPCRVGVAESLRKAGSWDRRWWDTIRHKEESMVEVIKEWATSLLVIVAIPYLAWALLTGWALGGVDRGQRQTPSSPGA